MPTLPPPAAETETIVLETYTVVITETVVLESLQEIGILKDTADTMLSDRGVAQLRLIDRVVEVEVK